MPYLLYRYILKDLLKLLCTSTAVLVLVISIGFMIKPISEGALDAVSMVKLLFYVMPGMLTYALPVGAAFASTMVFFRLSTDNEITACAMSGISYRSLLMPPLMLGLVLTMSMFFLSNFVIPSFWQRVAQVAQQDVARWFVNEIESKKVVKLDRQFIIYADHAAVEDLPPMPDDDQLWPYQRVRLEHTAVGKIDRRTGELEADFTGELAVADMYHVGNRTIAMVKLTNAAVKHPDTGMLVVVREHAFPPKQIPSLIEMSPKMLSLRALHEMSEKPDINPEIERLAEDLRLVIGEQYVLREVKRALTESATKTLTLIGPQGEDYIIAAPRVTASGNALNLRAEGGRPVTVRIGRGVVMTQRLEAQAGQIDVIAGEEPRIAIKLEGVTVHDPRLPAALPEPTQVRTIHLTLLRFRQPIVAPLRQVDALGLLKQTTDAEPIVAEQAALLARQINRLREDISLMVHERSSMAVIAMMVMLMGGVMAMLLRQQVPLIIFFWCFLPAIAAIFMVNGGKGIIESNTVGLGDWFDALMIWSGNLFLLGVIAIVYHRLCRH